MRHSGESFVNCARRATELSGRPNPPAYPVLQTIADKDKPEVQHVWIRGNESNPGEPAPPHFLAILSPGEPKVFDRGKERMELAEAIASRDNPLTARVIVNRVWQQHFGYGIVRTPSNFGRADTVEPSALATSWIIAASLLMFPAR